MSIASEITRLQGAKSDLKTSIEGKGVTVPAATKIDGYAALVDQIQQGGGGGHTGTVDTAGLTALGWDAQDIQWLQDHVWWDAEDDAEWAVTEANKAFGPAGATPLTWATKATIQYNPDCRYLPKLTPTSNINNMYNIFATYPHLAAIPTHGWNMGAVTTFARCFADCASLRSVGNISYWVTSVTTTIYQMFYQCSSLEEIDVSHWDTSNCTGMHQAFQLCVKLKAIDVSHWDTSNCTSMYQAFQLCVKLKAIDISSWSFAKVTLCQQMFDGCSSLVSIKLPTTINAPVLTTANGMFSGCYSLIDIEMNLIAPSLTNINNFINNCKNLKRAKVNISSSAITAMTYLLIGSPNIIDIDLMGIDTSSCAQSGMGAGYYAAPFGNCFAALTVKLGANFFNGTFTTLYADQAYSWTRDSIYESLYTNQTSRDGNSNAVTVRLPGYAYNRLSAQDISDIATKNITLTRG